MLLTKTFPAESYRLALEAWAWLPIAGKVPVMASLFGDLLLQDGAGYWYLDTVEGTLTHAAATRDEMQAILDTEDGQDRYLLGALAMGAEHRGLHLQPAEVYSFKAPPILGGTIDVESIVIRDFVVAVNVAGQLHEQLQNRDPGSEVTGIVLQP